MIETTSSGISYHLRDIYSNDPGYVPLVVNTSWSFPDSRLTSGFATRLTRQVPLVEQELLTLPEHPSSPPVFIGVRVTQSLVLYVWVMTSTLPKRILGSVASLLAATLYQGNHDRNHKLWNILSSERYILHIEISHVIFSSNLMKMK
jgi:hypothetical protein